MKNSEKKHGYSHIARGHRLFILVFYMLIFFSATAQQSTGDSVFYKQATDNLLNNYKKEIGPGLHLYNGPEYVRNGQKAKGFPFFESDNLISGLISYNGTLYKDIDMRYDLSSDQVIINTNNNTSIQLVDEKVNYFCLLNHYFIRIAGGKTASSIMKPGFYEIIYNGAISVFIRREKKLVFPPSAEEEPRYAASTSYFVKKDNMYYDIDSRSSLLYVLKDRKDDLKKYTRANNINFKKQFAEDLVKTVQYYDQIKP